MYISGIDLYQMFNYGTYYVMQERQKLNDINVFPVPDGDTGDNLLQTMRTIVLESKMNESFVDALESISNSALIGARGNSGVIFAQFVNGLQLQVPMKDKISLEEFAIMVENSYKQTIASLSNPVEGTMITIMREWANSLKELLTLDGTLKELFLKSFQHIKSVLSKTPTMLDVLGENDVVDSGAYGFTLFVKGIVSYYNNDPIDVDVYDHVQIADHHDHDQELTFRYCTEGLIKNEQFELQKVVNSLNKFGDSLIVAQGKERFRVHIHSNQPELVFKTLENFGTIETQKVDDMLFEVNIRNSKKKRVLVTDSIADIDKDILDRNDVFVIPINISIEGVPYLDKLSITNSILFDKLEGLKNYPSTATPSIKYINDLFSKLLLKFEEVIVLTVSKELSGTYNVIKAEAEKLVEKGKRIYVIDSKNNSATEGLLVSKIAELMNSDLSTLDIIERVEKLSDQTQILVCLDTFKYATMSGRVPKTIGKIGILFGLRPIMSLKNGKGTAFGMALNQKGITKKIKKLLEKDLTSSGIERYSIVHCLNPELAKEYSELFTGIIGKPPISISEISSATAIHSGVGSVAIGYIKNKEV